MFITKFCTEYAFVSLRMQLIHIYNTHQWFISVLQMNGGGGYDYYAYYDYYGDYPEPHYGYGRPQGKRNFHERDGRPSPAKLEKEKSRDKEEEEEPSLEDDFVSSRLKANLTLMLLVANLANTK